MISSTKKSAKRIWKGIVIAVLLTAVTAVILTKIIYDSTFVRCDTPVSVSASFADLTDTRELHTFPGGENALCGYLYRGSGDTLIVLVPGHNAGADQYLAQISDLTAQGFGVFSFDPTGCYRSEGSSAVGFSQTVYDLEAALAFVQQQQRFGYTEVVLLGHSRGGYAACAVLNKGYDLAAVITVSGVNSCMEAVMQPVVDRIGWPAYGNYPLLWLYQVLLFDAQTVNADAADAIHTANVPTLIVQGAEDEKFTTEAYSIYAHGRKRAIGNAVYYLCDTPGQSGHIDLLFDADGSANDELMAEICRFLKETI